MLQCKSVAFIKILSQEAHMANTDQLVTAQSITTNLNDSVTNAKGEIFGTLPTVESLSAIAAAQDQDQRSVLRVTNSIAQYNVSAANPEGLANLGKALAGSIDRDDITFLDPESKKEIRLGDVLVSVDLSNPDQIVLLHRDSAGKGYLGRVFQSISYLNENPFNMLGMKAFGLVPDPEVVYKQKVVQMLAQLDREGLFGPPGASTFNLSDWEVGTRSEWRDVVIQKVKATVVVPLPSFGQTLSEAFGALAS
jgi:hypothetical protein